MAYEIFEKALICRNPVPHLSITKYAVVFNKAASMQWVRGKKYVEISVDREICGIRFRFLDDPAANSFIVSMQGAHTKVIRCLKFIDTLTVSPEKLVRLSGTFDEKCSIVEVKY